jgi:hypothetical protein
MSFRLGAEAVRVEMELARHGGIGGLQLRCDMSIAEAQERRPRMARCEDQAWKMSQDAEDEWIEMGIGSGKRESTTIGGMGGAMVEKGVE